MSATTKRGTGYVAGFLFDDEGTHVALVRKNRPDWQSGLLNGIGGHIEAGERPDLAMTREFQEEAGVTLTDSWERFVTVSGQWGFVAFYRAFDTFSLARVCTRTDEPIEVHEVASLAQEQALPNLSWLIPLARYRHDVYYPLHAMERW